MGLYERTILPRALDYSLRGDEINALRAATLAGARGRVLELGFGTGLNARHYPSTVDELVVVDHNPGMSDLALRRLAAAGREARHAVLSGDALPFEDASFDTVVSTFTLCSIRDVDRALQEARRVLASGGRLLFLEHVASDDARVLRWQRRLNPLWGAVSGGCHLDRDAPALIADSGMSVVELETSRLDTLPIVATVRRGAAVAA